MPARVSFADTPDTGVSFTAVTLGEPRYALAELQEQFKASKYHTAAEWRKLYQDGTALGWLQQVTDFYARFGGIQNPVPARTYFDTSLLVDNVKA